MANPFKFSPFFAEIFKVSPFERHFSLERMGWHMRRPTVSLLLSLALGSWVGAQTTVPTAPTAATTSTTAATSATSAASSAQPASLWSFLGLTQENHKKHMQCLCDSQIGQLANSMTMPLGFATGGLIGPLCPTTPSADELAALADPNSTASPAEAAAAKIKADVAGAQARIAAIEYLATCDCHYYPEAEEGLIAGLRADRVECVRYAAAVALGRGCCCTKKTIAALTITVTGKNTDGNPSETSDRVKAAAMYALNLCMAKVPEVSLPSAVPPELPPQQTVPPLVPPEQPPATKTTQATTNSRVVPIAYYQEQVPHQNAQNLIQSAGRVMAESVGVAQQPCTPPTGKRGLLDLWRQARQTPPAQEDSFYEAALGRPNLPSQNPSPVVPLPRAKISFPLNARISQPKEKETLVQVSFSESPQTNLKQAHFSSTQRTNPSSVSKPVPFPKPNVLPPMSQEKTVSQNGKPLSQSLEPLPQSRTTLPSMSHFGQARQPVGFTSSSALIRP